MNCECLTISTEPVLRETAYGKWLATTPDCMEARIGVIGDTEWHARATFSKAVYRWLEILDTANSHADFCPPKR